MPAKTSIRLIDNKKVLITDDEFDMYKKICRSYDAEYRKGEDYFKDHFETNGSGIIVFVKPAHGKYTSMEIYCFLLSLMVNQQLRNIQEQAEMLVKEASDKFKELAKQAENK